MNLIRTLYDLAKRANQRYYQRLDNHSGIDVIDEDWDTLIILDGCRYDLFAEVCELSGTLEKRTSHGTESSEFIEKNFSERQLHDTIYVSANPYTRLLDDRTFYKIINLLENGWDQEYHTVLPETVTKQVLNIIKEHPDKRLIAHYMQPHYPFIGDHGQTISHKGITAQQDTTDEHASVWKRLQWGELSSETVEDAYRENLEVVLESVETLCTNLPGKTVITSDHGNLLGDWVGPIPTRAYGHPHNLYTKHLVEVPWFVIESETRRSVRSEAPVTDERVADKNVDDRLRHLGYTE